MGLSRAEPLSANVTVEADGLQIANLHDLPRIAVGDWRANLLLVKLDALRP